MGRPARKNPAPEPAPVRRRSTPEPEEMEPPSHPEFGRLYAVNGDAIRSHPFGSITSPAQRWKLIRQGLIPAVHVGRRVYLTERAMSDFIAQGGARFADE